MLVRPGFESEKHCQADPSIYEHDPLSMLLQLLGAVTCLATNDKHRKDLLHPDADDIANKQTYTRHLYIM